MGESVARWIPRAIGLLLLLIGIGSLVIAPLEMICFSWFSEGGRFGYEGFGFGSFMFGNLAMQILGYYVIAAVSIPLGYGNLLLRRWARPLTLALAWVWWVLGVPLVLVFLFVLFSAKDLSVVAAIVTACMATVSYVALPGLLIRFYRGSGVRETFERGQPSVTWVERLGVPILTLVALEGFYFVALHVLIFFGGLFPFPWTWMTGLPGLTLIDGAAVVLLLLMWGTVRRERWAFWGALAYFGALGVLWVGTLVGTSWAELLAVMAFPPTEMAVLDGIPLQGWHLAALLALPLVGTMTAIVRARGEC